MDARWMPIFAATVGVLGGVGGALVGGFVANAGQAEGFKRERAAAKQDLRTEVYGAYLGTAEGFVLTNAVNAEQARKNDWLVKVFVARARVYLVTDDDEVAKAAEAVTTALIDNSAEAAQRAACGDDKACLERLDEKQYAAYKNAGDEFLSRSRQEIAETTK